MNSSTIRGIVIGLAIGSTAGVYAGRTAMAFNNFPAEQFQGQLNMGFLAISGVGGSEVKLERNTLYVVDGACVNPPQPNLVPPFPPGFNLAAYEKGLKTLEMVKKEYVEGREFSIVVKTNC